MFTRGLTLFALIFVSTFLAVLLLAQNSSALSGGISIESTQEITCTVAREKMHADRWGCSITCPKGMRVKSGGFTMTPGLAAHPVFIGRNDRIWFCSFDKINMCPPGAVKCGITCTATCAGAEVS